MMKAIDLPTRIPTPWAEDADPAFISAIPETTAVPGRASYTAGFSPINMQPIASGGIPPFGQDFNGAFNQWTAWLRWQAVGGPAKYDATFASSIGGYPAGAVVLSSTALGWWISRIDDNLSGPDGGGPGWLFIPLTQIWAGDPNGHVAGNAASNRAPPSTVWDTSAGITWICVTTGNAAAAVWRPLPALIPITMAPGANRTYVADDNDRVYIRSNGGSAMADTLPDGTVENGWHTSIINGDATGTLVVSAPGGRRLNGTLGGSLTMTKNQNVTITANSLGDFWMTAVPVPTVFSAQAVYVSSSLTLVPGVYDLDTRPGAFTITLESGGAPGDNYLFRDVGGVLADKNVTIDPNGSTINGSSALWQIDTNWSETVINYNAGDWEIT